MHYIVLTRHEDLWLVGPFPSNDAAADYGATVAISHWEDDPRWQTIKLADTFGLRVEPPADVVVSPGAYRRGWAAAA